MAQVRNLDETTAIEPSAPQAPVVANQSHGPVELGIAPAIAAPVPTKAILGFLLIALGPALLCLWYLETHAADRYASRAAFSIRSNEAGPALEIFGAVAQLGGGGTTTDGQILYDFIQSQQIVEQIREAVPLELIWNKAERDLLFALGQDQPVEELHDHWDRMVDISLDSATGILTLETQAFTPEDSLTIAKAILRSSSNLVNQLSDGAREDAVRFAATELDSAETRLRKIRTRLRSFRDLEQEVDPTQNAKAALGLVATLEEERARTQVRLDDLLGALDDQAPRVTSLKRRIRTLDEQIAQERTRLGRGDAGAAGSGRALSDIVGDYEELLVDREFAEQTYRLALATYEQAQTEARRRHRHLAVHVRPTLSERADHPDKPVWLITVSLAGFAFWAVLMLVIGNIRERR
ncbi:MAG: capsule biosynthesis protein [Pseudomonadota bacterium]